MSSGQKRPAPPDENNAPVKHVKAEHPEEFSNAVKKRLASSTRTGQACDRCKVTINNIQLYAQLMIISGPQDPMRWATWWMFAVSAE